MEREVALGNQALKRQPSCMEPQAQARLVFKLEGGSRCHGVSTVPVTGLGPSLELWPVPGSQFLILEPLQSSHSSWGAAVTA